MSDEQLRAAANRTIDWYKRQASIGLCAQNGRDAIALAEAWLTEHPAEPAQSAKPCDHCGGAGVVDSGGFTPWGAPIDVPCPECGRQR